MELRHLRYFVAVAEELHFGRAAERLRIAQPPLSQQIKGLETELGTRLFDRNRRKVELTAAGRSLLDEAREILRRAENCGPLIRHVAAGDAGRIDIAFTGSVPFNTFMPQVLRTFRRRHPQVWITLREMSTGSQIEAVLDRRLDVGFARPADSHLPVGVEAHHVLREPLVLAVPSDHRLAGRPVLHMEEIADDPLVMNPRHIGTGLYDRIMQLCQGAGFNPIVALEAHQMSTMISLVAAGLGLAVVPQTMQRLRIEEVWFADIADPNAFIDLLVITRKGRVPPVVRNLLDVVAEMTPR